MNKQWTLREKIAQLMMVGFHGKTPSKQILNLIEKEKIGSVILFARNIGSQDETKALTMQLQQTAKDAQHPFPLLIAIDQENGIVSRLNEENTVFPGNMLLGACDDTDLTYEISRATALELKTLGINMNLAPVLDVNHNPKNPVIGVRSYGEQVDHVSNHGRAFIKGHQDEHVLTSGKHFPGHGNTSVDSHLALPIVDSSREDLFHHEIAPFHTAIKHGLNSVMVNHVYYKAFEEEAVPATLSKTVITDLLREELQFNGVVVTDCLEMKAISDTVTTPEGAVQAIQAGADLLIVSQTYDVQMATLDRIEQAVINGEISVERINQSLERVNRLKQNIKMQKQVTYDQEKHQTLARKAFQKGVTIRPDAQPLTPLKRTKKVNVFWFMEENESIAEDIRPNEHKMVQPFKMLNWEHVFLPWHMPTDVPVTQADTHIIFTNAQKLSHHHLDFIGELINEHQEIIFVALKSPYVLSDVPESVTQLAVYEPNSFTVDAVLNVILGKEQASGKLPVTI
ncbi:MAG TPA: beta-N-acetylhexosaminidase [Cerasibacillus sp.]|uniref:beta-N-acetylhexosaminidase n=1 Tax=Cerasibacillus sp. TaxID=2498711 RepID=UPI002F41D108